MKLCQICGKELPKKYQNRSTSKYCSRDCYRLGHSKIMMGHKSWNKGLTKKDNPSINLISLHNKGKHSLTKGKSLIELYGEEKAKEIRDKWEKNGLPKLKLRVRDKNPNWKGNFAKNRTTYHQRARKHKKDYCERCNKQIHEIKRLEVHHKDGDIKNNKLSNLITLCNRCHQIKDNRINMERDYHGRFISN